MTAGEFRISHDGAGMFNKFREELILPYLQSSDSTLAVVGWIK